MLFPIQQLIEGRGGPLSIPQSTLVREALTLMVENDYSQLPVINGQGNLIGMISETSIISTYYHIDTAHSLLDLSVDHCMTQAKTISPESDIFEALNILENVYAIVVVENQKPKGILTDYDTTHFFRDLSEGLIIVEDIEVSLRQYIEFVFSNARMMDAALMQAFKENKKDPTRPAKEFEELSFRDHIQLIITAQNWEKFAKYFEPKEIFKSLMDNVGDIRNQLAHFRGRLEPIQLHALLKARDWLSARPKIEISPKVVTGSVKIWLEGTSTTREGESKYDPLYRWLLSQGDGGQSRVRLDFKQVEELIGQELPSSARQHRSWWANDPSSHTQASAWVSAGWLVDEVDLSAEKVNFRQTNSALYYTFFSDLLARLKTTRPGITQSRKAGFDNWLSFSSGIAGFAFGWVLPREHILRVELSIDKGDKDLNESAYETLLQRRSAIEEAIGEKLTWDKMEGSRSSRIYASKSFHISRSPEHHEAVKAWGVQMMLKFVDVFRPMLREI